MTSLYVCIRLTVDTSLLPGAVQTKCFIQAKYKEVLLTTFITANLTHKRTLPWDDAQLTHTP